MTKSLTALKKLKANLLKIKPRIKWAGALTALKKLRVREAEQEAKHAAKIAAREAKGRAKREAEEVKKAKRAEKKTKKQAEQEAKHAAKIAAKEAKGRARREAEEAKKAKRAEKKANKEAEHRAKIAAREAKERARREAEEAKAKEAEESSEPDWVPPIDREKALATYPVNPPYAFIAVETTEPPTYRVCEVELSPGETELLKEITARLYEVVNVDFARLDRAEEFLKGKVEDICQELGIRLSPKSMERIMYYVVRDLRGYGKLDPVMRDERVEDISADGPGIPVYVFHRNYSSLRSNIIFSEDELDSLIYKFSQRGGRHISISNPLVDASLPNQDRLQLSIGSEVTTRGSTFTVRKFRATPFSPVDLIYLGTISMEMAAYFWLAVENGFNIMIAGATASGKTTFLNAISMFIPPSSKIISIEDTREVNLLHQNWIPSVTRESAERGSIDTFDLLRAALRQRPEYLLLGEVRGREAHTLFQAMATGHITLSTVHADSVEAVVKRLTKAPIEVPLMLLDSMDIVAIIGMLKVGERRVRRCTGVVEVTDIDFENETLKTQEVFRLSPAGFQFSGESEVFRRIMEKLNMGEEEFSREFGRRVRVMNWLGENHVTDFRTLSSVLFRYSVHPDEIEKSIQEGKVPAEVEESLQEGKVP